MSESTAVDAPAARRDGQRAERADRVAAHWLQPPERRPAAARGQPGRGERLRLPAPPLRARGRSRATARRNATAGPPGSGADGDQHAAPEPAAAAGPEPAADDDAAAHVADAETEAYEESIAPAESEPLAEEDEEPLEDGEDDVEGARLIALNMALNGTPREETDRYLAENFDLADRDALLDEVYASVEG